MAAALPWHRALSPAVAALLVVAYGVLSRIEFEIGPGAAVPVQLVLVPMLFLLPPALVPLCVAAGYLLGALPEYARGVVHPARALALLSSSWYAVGPAVVLSLSPSARPEWDHAHVYVAALLAQFACDAGSSAVRERFAFGHSPLTLLPAFAWLWAVDAALSPLALVGSRDGAAGLLVVLPLAALLAFIARDRRTGIDRAFTVAHAYRGALEESRRDELTGIANRRQLLIDLAAACSGGAAHVLVLFDLNGFKAYNDAFGHPAGDELLRVLAGRLDTASALTRARAYRLGGDEFCVLAPAPAAGELGAVVGPATAALSDSGDGFSVSPCHGMALIPVEAADPATALAVADRRLYAQKRARSRGRSGAGRTPAVPAGR